MEQSIEVKLDLEREEADSPDIAGADPESIQVRERQPYQDDSDELGVAGFIEPITLIATVTAAWVVSRIVNHWLPSREQGVLIDLRTTPTTISTLAGVPRGFVVVVDTDSDGATRHTQHKYDYDKPEQLSPLLRQTLAVAGI